MSNFAPNPLLPRGGHATVPVYMSISRSWSPPLSESTHLLPTLLASTSRSRDEFFADRQPLWRALSEPAKESASTDRQEIQDGDTDEKDLEEGDYLRSCLDDKTEYVVGVAASSTGSHFLRFRQAVRACASTDCLGHCQPCAFDIVQRHLGS